MADPLTEKYPEFISKFYNSYGAISQINGNYVKAINYYQDGLKINEKYNDLNGQSVMLGNIGAIYIQIAEYQMALKYQKMCLAVLLKLNKEQNIASVYNNMSIIYTALANYDLALQYALKAKAIYEKLNDLNNLSYCLGNIGNIYESTGKNKEALELYYQALKMAQQTENTGEIGKMYNEIGSILFKENKPAEAKEYLDKAKTILAELGDIDGQIQTYGSLYTFYKQKKDFKNALINHEMFLLLRDSLAKEDSKREIHRKALEFDYNKKVAADSVKLADERLMNLEKLKAKNAEISAANTQKAAFIVIAVILLIVSFIIFNRFRLIQKQKEIIEIKNKQTEEQKLIIEEKQKEIVDSINYAKRIQDSLLDNYDIISKFFKDAFIFNKPKDIVSGDFYWISKKLSTKQRANSNKSEVIELFFIAVCDSTGHGVPGGFMSLLNMAYLSEAINEKNILEPNKIFDYVRDRLINTVSKHEQKDGFDGVLIKFEKKQYFEDKNLVETKYKMDYAAAYNSPLMVKNGKLIEMQSDKMPVGYGERDERFNNYSVDLESGDIIYVYTDGYADQFGGTKGKKFKYKQLNELLLKISSEPMLAQQDHLNKHFYEWKGDLEQVDDVCVIGVRI